MWILTLDWPSSLSFDDHFSCVGMFFYIVPLLFDDAITEFSHLPSSSPAWSVTKATVKDVYTVANVYNPLAKFFITFSCSSISLRDKRWKVPLDFNCCSDDSLLKRKRKLDTTLSFNSHSALVNQSDGRDFCSTRYSLGVAVCRQLLRNNRCSLMTQVFHIVNHPVVAFLYYLFRTF